MCRGEGIWVTARRGDGIGETGRRGERRRDDVARFRLFRLLLEAESEAVRPSTLGGDCRWLTGGSAINVVDASGPRQRRQCSGMNLEIQFLNGLRAMNAARQIAEVISQPSRELDSVGRSGRHVPKQVGPLRSSLNGLGLHHITWAVLTMKNGSNSCCGYRRVVCLVRSSRLVKEGDEGLLVEVMVVPLLRP
ncbi:hypothetical protein PIB30_040236 [Stylosanthes scabra]|uniref:Uncharacterized protein n=1 Tax=Stylosanthes scabra TaxID=79078 RepID=A0ABU6UDU2_9FABA|nr:hypothetical protein [Stylosanthes scabra]